MRNKLLYNLIIKPLSWLPFWLLYMFSDLAKFFIYTVFGYRKKVVLTNMRNSFPEKSEEEISKLASEFYSHFTDVILESVKLFSISEADLAKRMVSLNSEVFDAYYEEGRDVIVVSSHFGNWEMCATFGQHHMPHSTRGVYMPMKNKYWNEKAKTSRSRFGMNLVPRKEAISQLGISETPVALILLVDQSPHKDKRCYWTNFLNQETAVNFGVERLANDHNAVVIYGHIQKVKRGYFEVTYSVISDDPTSHSYGWLTEKTTRKIEEKVREYPQYWLWTHKRWKRTRREDEELCNIIDKV